MVNINVFSQILGLVDRDIFNRLVKKYQSDKYHKGINSWTHFVSMLFCHLSSADSVRDISNGLRSTTGNMNHMGISRTPSKSNLSYMNSHRDHGLFRDLYYGLLDLLWNRDPHRRAELRRLKSKILLMDATIIPLCLSAFDWAKFRSAKGAVKLHTILDYDGCMPSFVHITDGKQHESKVAKTISFPQGCVLVVDRGYVDYAWMNILDSTGCFFVTRSKSNMKYTVIKTIKSEALIEGGIIEDQIIELVGSPNVGYAGKKIRQVRVLDSTKNVVYEFLTNNFSWKPKTVASLYKERWEIETFFKHLKQRLKVTSFVGTSQNAVYIQIWTALIGILLFKYIQKKAKYDWNLSNLVNFIRLNIFVKIDLWKWADDPFISGRPPDKKGQFALF
ncbi:IS4 family transposase [Sphingobacterium sp. IITKGP-BTPF85]|uniref:IS4 family transposase n=1 Tax=Sphingobacterium sp. IITKGP-BTPF85 TaxID=1338009 RepID=UPI00038A2687|nr:IS4 family transposase [Sphingobacterium sp. IITKGP-BTPF85]KKX46427.1 hypothetical protein L950_0232050 [Sphingobacterium sp. IITKGP-BTPF85]